MKKLLIVPLLMIFLFTGFVPQRVSAQTQCSSYVPGPGGSYICVPVAPATTPAPVQSNTTTVSSGGFGSVVANPGDTAYSLSVRCGVDLSTFKAANGLSGTSPIVYAQQAYSCGLTGAPVHNTYNPAPAAARSIADGTTFTVTNEKSWDEVALKCANARTGADDILNPAVNPGIGYLQTGMSIRCPLYNDSNDPTPIVVSQTIPQGSTDTWWIGNEQVQMVAIAAIPVGTEVGFSTTYTANAVAVVKLVETGVVVGYIFPVVLGTTAVVMIAMANARVAVNSDHVLAVANANASASGAGSLGQTNNPMPPNCEGAWQTLFYSFSGVTNTTATIARAELTGGAASTFTAALSLMQSSLCAEHFDIRSDATHWYLSKK